MSDLIDRNAVMLRVREFIGNPTYNENILVNDLNALPSAEPERKKGKWVVKEEDWRKQQSWDECSECGFATSRQYNFCPNCGADMRGE